MCGQADLLADLLLPQLAILHGEAEVLDALCDRGADVNRPTSDDERPLWLALQKKQEALASVLVKHGCDLDAADEETGQTMLHRAVEEDDAVSAVFLIRQVCSRPPDVVPALLTIMAMPSHFLGCVPSGWRCQRT